MKLRIFLPADGTDVLTIHFVDLKITVPHSSQADGQWMKQFDVYATIVEKLHEYPSVIDIIDFSGVAITIRRHHMQPWEEVLENVFSFFLDSFQELTEHISIDCSPAETYPCHQHHWDQLLMYVNPSC